jgi:hypothetical protein
MTRSKRGSISIDKEIVAVGARVDLILTADRNVKFFPVGVARFDGIISAYGSEPPKSPTRNLRLSGLRPRQSSYEEERQGHLQPRERGLDGRLEIL